MLSREVKKALLSRFFEGIYRSFLPKTTLDSCLYKSSLELDWKIGQWVPKSINDPMYTLHGRQLHYRQFCEGNPDLRPDGWHIFHAIIRRSLDVRSIWKKSRLYASYI